MGSSGRLPGAGGLSISVISGLRIDARSNGAVHYFGGGGQTVEAAVSCAGGGGGKGLEAALGAGSALAVCVLRPPTWWTGFDTGWSTTWTGLGARVGGGFSQNEWSGCGPRVTWTVCG